MRRQKTKQLGWALVFALGLSFSGCQTAEVAEEPKLYSSYQETVRELREAVERGDLPVTRAEELRREAFQDYMEALKEKQVGMEYRNY